MLFVTAGLVVLVGAAAVAAADSLQEVLRRGGTIDIQTIVQLVLNASPSGRLCYRIIFF